MSGRYRNDERQMRSTDKPRKTMKILSGTRFQWIAFDTEKKEFKGTGGGTYTTINGKYSEKIEFFSRDKTRVGMSLEFDYNMKLKGLEVEGVKAGIKEKEDRKDERSRIEATHQSELIEQRQKQSGPKSFESGGNDILGGGFGLGTFDPK